MRIEAPPKPPSPDELEALIPEARERQLRRRLLGAAGLAVAAAIGISLYAVTAGQTSRPGGQSRFADRVPLCRASQLSVLAGLAGAAGPVLVPTLITNISSSACALPTGRPGVRVAFRGKPIRTRERSWGTSVQFGPRAARVLNAGGKVYFEVGWDSLCPRPEQAPTTGRVMLTLLFRGGLQVSAPETTPEGVPGVPGCDEVLQPTPWLAVSPALRLH
jgi:hypothetical protein